MDRHNTRPVDTSWQKVAGWYKDVPKNSESLHSTLIIPQVLATIKKFIVQNSKVLDLACGEGTITDQIQKNGYKVVGIDMSKQLINDAKHNYPDINFFIQDVRSLTAGFVKIAGQFDCVLCVLALQNIDDLDSTFKQVSQILKPNGKFIFLINHPYFRIPKSTSWGFEGLNKQYRIVDSYMSEQKIPIVAHPGRPDSSVTYSFHRPFMQYIKLLNKNGFSVIDLEEIISNKKSELGKRSLAEDKARREIPLFMSVVAQRS